MEMTFVLAALLTLFLFKERKKEKGEQKAEKKKKRTRERRRMCGYVFISKERNQLRELVSFISM